MGIYINGVEMPKSCGHCFMNHICERIPTQKAMFVTKRLKGCPIVQAREPKCGEWIVDEEQGTSTCSNCGIVWQFTDGTNGSNFCPNCGCDMRPKLQGTYFDSIIIDECALKGADDE